MAVNKNQRKTGADYETMAAKYLSGQGYRILEQNYRSRYGEIDIVAKMGSMLIFTEVKYRTDSACGDPLEAVDIRKQRRISRTALYYYACHGYGEYVPCRFDVIAIYGDGRILHIVNAFELQV